jgi:hypothetical protein
MAPKQNSIPNNGYLNKFEILILFTAPIKYAICQYYFVLILFSPCSCFLLVSISFLSANNLLYVLLCVFYKNRIFFSYSYFLVHINIKILMSKFYLHY